MGEIKSAEIIEYYLEDDREMRARLRKLNPIRHINDVKNLKRTVVLQQEFIEGLKKEKQIAERQLKKLWIEPGHFYSPVTHSVKFQHFDKRQLIPGIDLNTEAQLELLKEFKKVYKEHTFTEKTTDKNRYFFDNDQFAHTDSLTLYSMLRTHKPKRVVEVGSGYSSALMLDVNNQFFDNKIELTFIEPFPTRLRSLLRPEDKKTAKIIVKPVQDVALNEFEKLESGDILFIDSSHISKSGSDVNWLYFEVLPVLKPGVIIHIHDIPYPFEYFDAWIKQGRSWNEAYLLRALLIENPKFKLLFWGEYLHKFYAKDMRTAMPLSTKNHGGSLWIQRQ